MSVILNLGERSLGKRVCTRAPTGVDAIIDLTPPGGDMWEVLDGLRIGGTFVTMGGSASQLPYSARTLALKCWRIIGTRNHSRADFQGGLELLKEGRLDVEDEAMQKFPLAEVEAAVQQLPQRMPPGGMIVVKP